MKQLILIKATILFATSVFAQDSLALTQILPSFSLFDTTVINSSQQIKKKYATRKKIVTGIQFGAYTATSVGLYNFWYKDYPASQFHFFNDNEEYLQVDKVSHVYGAYLGGRMSMQLWKWAGASKKSMFG